MTGGEVDEVTAGELATLTFWPAAMMFYLLPPSAGMVPTMLTGVVMMGCASRLAPAVLDRIFRKAPSLPPR